MGHDITISNTYDLKGQLQEQKGSDRSDGIIEDFVYGYDEINNMTSKAANHLGALAMYRYG